MNIGGQEACLLVLRAADSAEIRGQRVEPDVKDVRLFAGNGNAPANGSARDAEIAEASFDEAKNFVAASFGLDEIGMLGVPVEKWLVERGELEIEIGFRDGFRWTATIGTVFAGLYGDAGIVVDAEFAGVVTWVDDTVHTYMLDKTL